MTPWWVAGVGAVALVMTIESLNRVAPVDRPWYTQLARTAPLILGAQVCLFWLFNRAPAWFAAWALFSVGTATTRMALVAAFEPNLVRSWLWIVVGVGAILAGGVAVRRGIVG